ncbi:MAG: PAS domain S-box protein [Chitinivibrionales bacterium]
MEVVNHVRDPARLAALRQVALLDTPTEESFDRLSRLAARVIHAPIALVTLIDSDRQFFKSSVGLPDSLLSRRQTPLSHSFCQHNRIASTPLIVEDARTDPFFKDNPAVKDFQVVAYLGIPLVTSDGYALGSFCVIDSKPRKWNQEDIDDMRDLAASVMTEIQLRAEISTRNKVAGEREKLVEKNRLLTAEISKREVMEKALRESEAKFSAFMENLPGYAYIKDRSRRHVYVNKSLASMFGRDAAECIGKTFEDLFGVEDSKIIQSNDDIVLRNEQPLQIEETAIINGEKIPHLSIKFPIRSSEDILYLGGISVDISDLRRAENEVSRERNLSNQIIDSLPGMFYLFDTDGHFLRWNKLAEKITGYSTEEFARLHPLALFTGEQRELVAQRIAEVFEHGSGSVEASLVHKNGSKAPYYFTGLRIEIENRPCLVGLGIDISERKRAESELKEQRWRMASIIEGTNVGTWEWNVQTGETIFNQRWAEIIGYHLNDLTPTSIDTWVKLSHPDDLKHSAELLQRHFDGSLDYYECECRMRHKDGHWVWVQDRGKLLRRTPEGKPLMMYGTHTDITERKRMEESLRDALHFNQRIGEVLPLVLYILGLSTGNNIYVNREVWQVLGYTVEQVQQMGKRFVPQVMHPEDQEHFKQHMAELATLPEDKTRQFEYRVRAADGSWRWVLSRDTIFARDTEGRPVQILGTALDITRRKHTEEALSESEERYRLFFETSPFALIMAKPFTMGKTNPSAKKLFGYTTEEFERLSLWELSPEKQPDGSLSSEKAAYYLNETLAGKPQYFEWRHRRKDRSTFDAEVALTRVYISGEPQIMSTIIDVTQRKNALERLKSSLREKETLLQEIYHRTKNNMMVISSFLQLQAASLNKPGVESIIDDSLIRIRTMSLAHEMLYKSQNLSRINMRCYFTGLAHLLAKSCRISPEQVNLHITVEEINLLIDIAVPCGLIVNELLQNSFKHAFPTGRKGNIGVGFKEVEKHLLQMIVEDDGVGLPHHFDIMAAPSLGVQLVRQIALHQLHATITTATDNGIRWSITFRDDLYAQRV